MNYNEFKKDKAQLASEIKFMLEEFNKKYPEVITTEINPLYECSRNVVGDVTENRIIAVIVKCNI